jgi:hypothetical protein
MSLKVWQRPSHKLLYAIYSIVVPLCTNSSYQFTISFGIELLIELLKKKQHDLKGKVELKKLLMTIGERAQNIIFPQKARG